MSFDSTTIAIPALREGVEFCDERELIGSMHYAQAWLARCELEVGRWDAAGQIAGALLRAPQSYGISRFVAVVTLGWLRARRGDPGVDELLDEGLSFARETRHLQRLWPIAACRAEAAWLLGRLDDELDLVEEAASLASELGWAPAIEELHAWLNVADGAVRGSLASARTGFGLAAAGRPDLAAQKWAVVGCPYEEAVARVAVGSPDELRAAWTTFDELGATPMLERVGAALHAAGEAVPRGPTVRTRRNPHELTDRELDVLGLLATGGTNRAIGTRLGISPKTVGHHVSHILAKLDVGTRAEAAVAAERLGLSADRSD